MVVVVEVAGKNFVEEVHYGKGFEKSPRRFSAMRRCGNLLLGCAEVSIKMQAVVLASARYEDSWTAAIFS